MGCLAYVRVNSDVGLMNTRDNVQSNAVFANFVLQTKTNECHALLC